MGNCLSGNSAAVVVTKQRNDAFNEGAIKRHTTIPKVSVVKDDRNDSICTSTCGTASSTSVESSTPNNIKGNKSFLDEKVDSIEDSSVQVIEGKAVADGLQHVDQHQSYTTGTRLQHKEHGDSVLHITSALPSVFPVPIASESLQTDKMYLKTAREVNTEINDVDIISRDSISEYLTIEGENSVSDKVNESIMEVKILQGEVRDENITSSVNLEVEGVSKTGTNHQEGITGDSGNRGVDISDARPYDYGDAVESALTIVIGPDISEEIINDEEKKYDTVDLVEITDARSCDYGDTFESAPTTILDIDILEENINVEEKSYDPVNDEASIDTNESMTELIQFCEAVSPPRDQKLVTLDFSGSKASDNLSLLDDIPSPTCSLDSSLAESSHNIMQCDNMEEQPENSLSIPVSIKNALDFEGTRPPTTPLRSQPTEGERSEMVTTESAVIVEMPVDNKLMMEDEITDSFQRAKSSFKGEGLVRPGANEETSTVSMENESTDRFQRAKSSFKGEGLVRPGATEKTSTISKLLSELTSLSSAFAKTRSSSPAAACGRPITPNACMTSQLKLAIDYENKQQFSHHVIVHPIQVSTRKTNLQRPSTETLLSVGKRRVLRSDIVKSCLSTSQQKLFERSSITSKIPFLRKSSAPRESAIPRINFPSLSRKPSPYMKSTRISLIPRIS